MKTASDPLTPRYARLLLRLTAPFPNFDVAWVKPLRARAIQSLCLRPGDRVLDAGCGSGGSFPFLADAVGPTGEVLGIEISPATVAAARRRIAANRWPQVHVVQSPAQSAPLAGPYDALLMFAAPDVYASAQALAHILPQLRPGARVVLFGAKTAGGFAGMLLNPALKQALSRLSFASTPLPDAEPWRLLGAFMEDLEVSELFFGTMFLASGTLGGTMQAGPKRAVAR